MLLFHWDRALESGIELVDKQHKQIMEAVNTLFLRRKRGASRADITECLGFLQQYILYHFQSEEAFQVRCHYPDYPGHQAIHRSIATQVKFFTVRMEASGYAEKEVNEFCVFLANWIREHILTEDLKFASCYRSYEESLASSEETKAASGTE